MSEQTVCWLNEDCVRGYHKDGDCRFPSWAADEALDRVRHVCERLDRIIESSGFDPLDCLTATTLVEAERQGFLDGVRTAVAQVQHAFQDPTPAPTEETLT